MSTIDYHALYIYTDGSAYKKPYRGGLAVKFIFPEYLNTSDKIFPLLGYKGANIAEMELKACVVGLEQALKLENIHNIKRLIVRTDRLHIVENYKNAMFTWPQRDWECQNGEPVSNATLWKELTRNISKLSKLGVSVDFEWVKGHKDNEHNKEVDRLAKESANLPIKNTYTVRIVRRKKSRKMTKKGSVHNEGQTFEIRVVQSEYLKLKKNYKLRCEVTTKKSPYFELVDFFYSANPLRPGHYYLIKLDKDKTFLSIKNIIRETRIKDNNI